MSQQRNRYKKQNKWKDILEWKNTITKIKIKKKNLNEWDQQQNGRESRKNQ